jgi:hypothetical protein
VLEGPIAIGDASFCFTGKLVDLKRAVAEREVRARGGRTLDRISDNLDYLVVGDEPSPAWKFGSYGRKIEQALSVFKATRRNPRLLSESAFMEALAVCPATNSGAIDEKVVVATFKFLISPSEQRAFDQDAAQAALKPLVDRFACHVSSRACWASVRRELFGDSDGHDAEGAVVVEYRFVRHQPVDAPVTDYVGAIEQVFVDLLNIDGTLRWFERIEGSADFVRLLREVPVSLRVAMP